MQPLSRPAAVGRAEHERETDTWYAIG